MAAGIGWYDTDDTTELDQVDGGAIPPGSSLFERRGSYAEVRAKNDGTEAFANVEVEIQQAGSYIGHEHVRIAPDAGGAPGTFQDISQNPLTLGAMAADAVEPVWIDIIVPGDAVGDVTQLSKLALLASL